MKPGSPADTVAVVGPGLIGGSLAMALGPNARSLRVWARRPEVLDELRQRCPTAHPSADLAETVAGADLVILCTPVGTMPDLAGRLLPHLKPGAIVTDVGSVKAPVVSRLEPIICPVAHFVGSHPMAGGDQTGIRHSRANLFQDAACIITPTPRTHPTALARVSAPWETLGCRLFYLPPDAHDHAVALISHLPHLLAATLVQTVARTNPAALDLAGPGFRDSTRIAMGSAPMWDEILRENVDAIGDAIRALLSELDAVQTALSQGEGLAAFLEGARAARLGLAGRQNPDGPPIG